MTGVQTCALPIYQIRGGIRRARSGAFNDGEADGRTGVLRRPGRELLDLEAEDLLKDCGRLGFWTALRWSSRVTASRAEDGDERNQCRYRESRGRSLHHHANTARLLFPRFGRIPSVIARPRPLAWAEAISRTRRSVGDARGPRWWTRTRPGEPDAEMRYLPQSLVPTASPIVLGRIRPKGMAPFGSEPAVPMAVTPLAFDRFFP